MFGVPPCEHFAIGYVHDNLPLGNTVEPRYNEVLGTMKITLLYQVSHYIRVKNRNIKSWDQQNYLVIRGFCYIRPLYNEVPLYCITICHYKQLQEGLMVFSDDFLHFLKIKKTFVEFTKTILWLYKKQDRSNAFSPRLMHCDFFLDEPNFFTGWQLRWYWFCRVASLWAFKWFYFPFLLTPPLLW